MDEVVVQRHVMAVRPKLVPSRDPLVGMGCYSVETRNDHHKDAADHGS